MEEMTEEKTTELQKQYYTRQIRDGKEYGKVFTKRDASDDRSCEFKRNI